jgi:hypothetical protein
MIFCLPAPHVFFFTPRVSYFALHKNFSLQKSKIFLTWNTTLVYKNWNFLKIELEKFRFLRNEIFIKGKIGFLEGKKKRGAGRKNFNSHKHEKVNMGQPNVKPKYPILLLISNKTRWFIHSFHNERKHETVNQRKKRKKEEKKSEN